MLTFTVCRILADMKQHPDVVEAWFKFSSAVSMMSNSIGCWELTRQVASRFPGVLLRLSDEVVHGYMSLGIMGLSAQERFSLKTATEFFVGICALVHLRLIIDLAADATVRSLSSPIHAILHHLNLLSRLF